MSSGLKVKAVSNMYTDSDLWGVWLCVGCLASIAEGDFYVFNGPCCRFPDFTSDPRNLKKGMNSIDEQGEIHTVRRCAGCLLAGKACIAPPDELFDELQAIQEQLKIIYDSSASALHSDAKGLVRDLAKDLTKTLERAPWTPHAVVLRLHNGETSADESPRSSVRSTASSKSKAAVKARDQAEDTHVSNLAAERLQNLQGSPGGRGNKV